MNSKQYAKRVCQALDNMSDAEFERLLIDSGLESCPIELEIVTFHTSMTYKVSRLYDCKSHMLVIENDNPSRAVA